MNHRQATGHLSAADEIAKAWPEMNTTVTPTDLILLTVEEAAERLRIGRTSMYHLVATGAVESVTVGRLRRVPVECLAEYVTRLRSGVSSKKPAA